MAYRKLTYEPDPLCIKCGHPDPPLQRLNR